MRFIGDVEGDRYQVEKHGQQDEIPADRLEQYIEHQRQADGADEHEQLAGNAEPPQKLGSAKIARGGSRVVRYEQSFPDESLPEKTNDNDNEIKDAAHSGIELG